MVRTSVKFYHLPLIYRRIVDQPVDKEVFQVPTYSAHSPSITEIMFKRFRYFILHTILDETQTHSVQP